MQPLQFLRVVTGLETLPRRLAILLLAISLVAAE
jgi:hypothetical protein